MTNHTLSTSYLYFSIFTVKGMVQQLLKWLASLAALHWKSYFLINCVSCYSWLTGSKSANSMYHVLGLTLPFPVPHNWITNEVSQCSRWKLLFSLQMRKWPRVNCDSSGSLDLFSELFTANSSDLSFWLIISLQSKPQDPSIVKSPLLLPLKVRDHFAEIPEGSHVSVH